ncbi:hypothetical protein [Schlesneria sp. DSM 10557]|uniref:hypothetical protein n=1 Tax=Schlesneria sp. DSM 10557 TaxID=3044399 RepID=UPI0035A18570
MQIADWFWNWLDTRSTAGSVPLSPSFEFAARLSSLKLEERRVLSVTPVLAGGVLDVSMTSTGDTAKISVVQNDQGVASILVTDQHNQTTSFLASQVDSIEITGAVGTQSVFFEGTNTLDVGSLTVHNSVDNVTFQSAVNVHAGPATILASNDIQIAGNGSLTADDPNSTTDQLNIILSADHDLVVQQLFATGRINLSGASHVTVTDGAAAHDVQAGNGIVVSAGGSSGMFVIESSADIQSLSGGVMITANRMDLDGTVTADGQIVSLAPNAIPLLPPAPPAGRLINLGTDLDGPDYLGLSATELSNIHADTLIIGSNRTGDIEITAAIVFAGDMDVTLQTGNHQIAFEGGSLSLEAGNLILRTGGGGAVFADASGLDLSAHTVSIYAGSGIGTSDHPLRMNATFLTTIMSNTNAGQFLSEFDTVTIAPTGLSAGAGTIHLVEGEFLLGGSERINNSSSVDVGTAATLNLQNFSETVASVSGSGSLVLGTSLLDTTSLSLNGDATLHVVINGLAPGTGYSQIEASGPVSLADASLDLDLGTSLTVGDKFTLLSNTGSSAIIGTFKNLPEGATFHVAATTFSISYTGGNSGHDIVLTVVATPTNVTLDSLGNLVVSDSMVGGNNDRLTIQSDVANGQYIIHDPVNLFTTDIPGAVISPDLHTIRVPFSAIPGTQVFVNTYGGDDSLTVDFSLGDFSRSVHYDGGTMSSAGDSFALTGGSTFGSVTHSFGDATSGDVIVSGNQQMTYHSVETTVVDSLTAENRTFTGTSGSENIEVVATGNVLTISSDNAGSITFVNPTKLLTIAGGAGHDAITVSSVNSGFRASLSIDGGIGTDVIHLNTVLNLGSTTAEGNLNVTAETVNLGANISTNHGPTGGNVVVTGTSAVNLTANVTIDTNVATGSDGNIMFNSPVNADQIANARQLTLTAGSGIVSLQNVGVARALDKFVVSSAGTTSLRQVQTGARGIAVTSARVDLSGDLTSVGNITIDGPITLSDSITISSTASGDIQFQRTLDGPFDLNVETAGGTRFGGAVGTTAALRSLTTDSPGTTEFFAGVTVVDSIRLNDSVRLLGDAALTSQTGGAINFAKQVDGPHHLTVNTAGVTTFGGVVGGISPLASLTTDSGGSTQVHADITTAGGIQFHDAVRLEGDATLTSTTGKDVGFASTIDGAHRLRVSSAGQKTFMGAVGGQIALTSLTTEGAGSTRINGGITASGDVKFDDDVSLMANTIITSTSGGTVAFQRSVNGPYGLTVNTSGVTLFNGGVGEATPLTSLTTDSEGVTRLNGNFTTSGAIEFRDAVVLTGNVRLTSSGGDTIQFGKTVDGRFGLTAVTSGGTRFDGTVGGNTGLAFLTTDFPGSTQLNANVTTTGNQTIRDRLELLNSVTMETTSSGNILLSSTVATNGHDLTLSAAGTGDVTAQAEISGGGEFRVKQAENVRLSAISVESVTIEQASQSVVFGGRVETTGSVSVTSSGSIEQLATVASGGSVEYIAAGPISVGQSIQAENDIILDSTASGLTVAAGAPLEAGRDLKLSAGTTVSVDAQLTGENSVSIKSIGTTTQSSAAEIISGSGGVLIEVGTLVANANITTSQGNVAISGPVRLASGIEISTGGSGDITVSGTINGTSAFNQKLTLDAGTGQIQVTGHVGNTVRLGEVLIVSANDVRFDGSLNSWTYQQLQGSGVSRFRGAVNTYGAIAGTNDGFQFTGASLRFDAATSSLDTHGRDITLTADAILLPTTFVNANGATLTIQTLSAGTSIGLEDASQDLNFTDAQLDVVHAQTVVIGSGNQTAGIKVGTDGPLTQSSHYLWKTAGSIIVNGSFQLDADHELTAQVGADLEISAAGRLATEAGAMQLSVARDTQIRGTLATASGSMTLDTTRDTTFGAAGKILSTTGDVLVTTGNGIDGTGALLMASGSLIDAGSGRVEIDVQQNVTLGQVKTANGTVDAIRITSHTGEIRNGSATGENLVNETLGGVVTLRAVNGIGTTSPTGGDPSLVTRVNALDIVNSAAGDIRIREVSDLQLHRVDQQGAGNVAIRSAGTTTITAGGSGVTATTGNVLLSAEGTASDLVLKAAVTTAGGDISLRASRDVLIDATAPVASAGGDVEVVADSNQVGNGTSGKILMQDGATIRSGSGTIALLADQDITLGQVETLNATANALRLVSTSGSLVNGGNSAGDNLIADAAGAVTTIQTAVGVGALQPINVDLDVLNLTNGASSNPLSGTNTRIHMIERDSIRVDNLTQHNDGEVRLVANQTITVGQISALTSGDSFVSLESTAREIAAGGNSANLHIAAETLVMRAVTGIGSSAPLVTNVSNLAATNTESGNLQIRNVSGRILNIVTSDGVDGISVLGAVSGNLMISNTATINVSSTVQNASGGNLSITALGNFSGLVVTAPVLATGGSGNIDLIAGDSINLFDTGVDADIRSEGSGVITIHSGNRVNFWQDVVVQSGTGSIIDAPPRFVNLQTPQITAGGIATITGEFGRPGEHNFTIIVNWNDGTTTTAVFEDPGEFLFTHFYNANPNKDNPSAPIPIDVTVIADPLIHVYGRNTTTNNALGSLDFTTLRGYAPVPGEGLGSFIFDLTPRVELLHFPEPQRVWDIQQVSSHTPTVALEIVPVAEKEGLGLSPRRKVFFEIGKRNADGTGWEFDEGIELTEDFLEQIFDPELIESIPDGRYRVQLQEPGETVKRLVIEFEIVNGAIADGTEPMLDDVMPESLRSGKSSTTETDAPDGGTTGHDPADALVPENDDPLDPAIEGSFFPQRNYPVEGNQNVAPSPRSESQEFRGENEGSQFAFNPGRRLLKKAALHLHQSESEPVNAAYDHHDATSDEQQAELDNDTRVTRLGSSLALFGVASTLAGAQRTGMPSAGTTAAKTGGVQLNRAARLMRKWTSKEEGI